MADKKNTVKQTHAAQLVSTLTIAQRNSLILILAHESGAQEIRRALGIQTIRITPHNERLTGHALAGTTADLFRDEARPVPVHIMEVK
jgi:hypothetical protein